MDASAPEPGLAAVRHAEAVQYLSFRLAGQDYGVEILRVQEIKCWSQPTRLPRSPDYVQGVINLRGAVVPVLDLRRRFALPEGDGESAPVVIIVRIDVPRAGLTAGIVVDAVCEVRSIAPADLRPPPQLADAIDFGFVRGLSMVEERMLILLDVVRLVNDMLADVAVAPKVA